MKIPSKEELPLEAKEEYLSLDETTLQKFRKAFRDSELSVPPTVFSVGLKGIFQILNSMDVDWKNLLHASQSFHFYRSPRENQRLKLQARLVDVKYRASMHWLQFEVEGFDEKSMESVGLSKSLIMIRDTHGT